MPKETTSKSGLPIFITETEYKKQIKSGELSEDNFEDVHKISLPKGGNNPAANPKIKIRCKVTKKAVVCVVIKETPKAPTKKKPIKKGPK